MPQYTCPACNARLYSAASPADSIDAFVARREAILARERLGLERWVDQQVDDRVGPIIARREAISTARTGPSSGGG